MGCGDVLTAMGDRPASVAMRHTAGGREGRRRRGIVAEPRPLVEVAGVPGARPSVSGRMASVVSCRRHQRTRRRQAGLRRMRVIATSLLGLAFVIFAATNGHRDRRWATCIRPPEAAMVGALADWFAVTAIFKHPPDCRFRIRRWSRSARTVRPQPRGVRRGQLPHRGDRAGTSGGGQRRHSAGTWLAEPAHRRRARSRRGPGSEPQDSERMRDEDVHDFVEHVLMPRLIKEPARSDPRAFPRRHRRGWGASRARRPRPERDSRLAGREPQGLLDADERASALVDAAVESTTGSSTGRISRQSTGCATCAPIPTTARIALDDLLVQLAKDLHDNPEVQARTEALKERVLTHPQVGVTIGSLWASMRTSLLRAPADPDSSLWARGDAWLVEISQVLLTDEKTRARLEGTSPTSSRSSSTPMAMNSPPSSRRPSTGGMRTRRHSGSSCSSGEICSSSDQRHHRRALAGLVIHAIGQVL